MNIPSLYQIFLNNPSVSTDTRNIQPGDLFFALKGPNFNGNEYTQQALDAGAAFCITDEDTRNESDKVIRVENSLETLQQLALHHRLEFTIPFIAITGTNGKTTTKELVHAVLSSSHTTYTTEGNLNNHIGIPLTLLKIRKDAHMAVVEMGANHIGEIKSYCNIVQPNFGLITNCGKAHLEGFGSEEGVRKGKGELYDFLRENAGTAFVNSSLPYLVEMSTGITERIFYSEESSLAPEKNDEQLALKMKDGMLIKTNLVGEYNLPNVQAAIAIGLHFNIPIETIKTALENYLPANNRSQMMKWNGYTVIMDAYNANPSSMIAAIKNFAALKSDKKILMLGSMKEMGKESAAEHRSLVEMIGQYQWEKVVLVGDEFEFVPPSFIHFSNSEQARQWLADNPVKGAHILLKGSRGVKMERVME